MTERLKRRRRLLIGVLLVAGLVAVMAVVGVGGSSKRTLTAYFADAHPVVVGNVVRTGGVQVGTVDQITVEDGRAKVEMSVDEAALPLHTDATVTITTQDLLGERFMALDRGRPDAPLLEEPLTLPNEQTNRVVDLQEVLNAVDNPTGTALSALLTTAGEGMDKRGAHTADAITALRPAMENSRELAGILDQQNALLTQLVDRAHPVAQALADGHGKTLDNLVGSTTDTMSAVAAREEKTQQTLEELPGTLTSARRTLAEVAGVADPTANTLGSIRPLTDDLTDVSGELQRFADAADPALASLPEVLHRADELLGEAGPLVQSLRPAGPHLRGIAPAVHQLSDEAVSLRLTNLMEFVKGWTLATSDYDAISHYFKAAVPATPKAAGHIAGGVVPGLPRSPINVPGLPGAPGATPATPPDGTPAPGHASGEGGSAPAGSAPTGNNTTGGADGMHNSGDAPADGGATGLNEEQEQSMLGQLLGGS